MGFCVMRRAKLYPVQAVMGALLAALAIFAALAFVPARAQDVDAMKVAALLMVQGAANGFEIEIGDAARDGNDIILRQVELQVEQGDTPETFAEVRLQNVRALASGGYMIGQVSLPRSDVATPDGTWSMGGWALREVLLPPAEDKSAFAFYSQSFEMQPSVFTGNDGKIGIQIGRVLWTSSPFVKGRALTTKLEPFDIMIDPAATPQVGNVPSEAFHSLGKIQMRIAADGSWRDTDGRSTVTTSVDVRNVGKLGLAFDLSGLTAARFHEMQKLFVGLQAKGAATASNVDFAALAEFGQVVKLHGFSLRFDDASATGRALDEAAKKNNQTRAQYVAQLKAMVPMFVAMLNDPKFSTQASAAVSTYLDNPKSIEIKLQPAQPATLFELGMLGMTAPQAVVRRLAPQITANK